MKFSPSSAHRWIGGMCTGSVKAEAAALRPPPSPQAEEGTRLHKLATEILRGNAEVIIDTAPGDWEIIGPYVEDVQAAEARYGVRAQYEYKIEQSDYGRGYIDAVLFTSSKVIIWDLKTGMRPVEAEKNWQLLLYAIMFDQRMAAWELRIVQQPGYHPDGPVRTWIVNDLAPYRALAGRARNEALGSEPKLMATPSNCLYCKAVTSCPAARNVTLGGMDLAMGGVGPIAADAIRTELVTLRNTKKLITSRLAALEAEAEERMRKGEAIAGCAMGSTRGGSLKWSAEPEQVRAVCSMVGQDAEIVSLRTPAQMIKAGVSTELIAAVTERAKPKMSVVTDADERTQNIFS